MMKPLLVLPAASVAALLFAVARPWPSSVQAAAPAAETPRNAVVVSAVENMYREADDATEVVSQAVLGQDVKILREAKGVDGRDWLDVETPDAYHGWILRGAVRPRPAGVKPYASTGTVFEVTSLFSNVYSTADVTERKPLVTTTIGARLESGAPGERWREVTLPDGRKGFVQNGDGREVDPTAPRPRLSVEVMVELSKRFLGLPYLWGGTTPFGLDCSGFVQLVYGLSGIPILRDADIQMTKSGLLEVPKGQEQAGDLIFFGRAIDRISHVGMMIDGKRFINATVWQKPIVQISDLSEDHWTKIYQAARRAK